MAIAASGAVSFSDLRSEFVGGSSAISYSDLYRGGSNIRAKAANNTGVNLAASVPTSGTINMTNFRSQAKGFRFTFSATATDQDASALFGSDYGVNYPKEIVVDSGVELGATSTSEEALEIDSGGAGTITVTNNGTLTGAGGAAGADGGDAFEAAVNCTFVNNGTIRAGGGGGGVGGGGSYSSNTAQRGMPDFWGVGDPGHNIQIRWYGVRVVYTGHPNYLATIQAGVWGSYRRGSSQSAHNGGGWSYSKVYQVVTNYSNGGAGGVGAGYNQSAGTGAGGGTNAGTGGTGGSFGASGSTGANSNSSNGSAGGAAGKYLRGSSFVTFTNNGTAQGGTA